jgi:hypothetical protein
MHPSPTPELLLYNLKPFAPMEEVMNSMKQFGEPVKYRFGEHSNCVIVFLSLKLLLAFDRFGPKITGRAHIGFNDVSSAQKLLAATMEEELVVNDLPVRAEYHWLDDDVPRRNPSRRRRAPRIPNEGSD